MQLKREQLMEIQELDKHARRIVKQDHTDQVLKMKFNGKIVDITEELIYLSGLAIQMERGFNNLDWAFELGNSYKDMELNNTKIKEIDKQMYELMKTFMESNNILLKSSSDVTAILHQCLVYTYVKMGRNLNRRFEEALNAALSVLAITINGDFVSEAASGNFCMNDEIGKICSYAILFWIADEEAKSPKDKSITKLIHKYIGNSFEEALEKEKEKNRFIDMYIEYKALCTEDFTDTCREKFWAEQKDLIVSDFGTYTDADFTEPGNDKRAMHHSKVTYLRPINDSFKNCFSDMYSSILDIEKPKDREIVYYLIQRYLEDFMSEYIRDILSITRSSLYIKSMEDDQKKLQKEHEEQIADIKEHTKLKINKVKKDMELTREQLKFSKEKAEKLSLELKKVDAAAHEKLKEKVKNLEIDNEQLRKTQSKHDLEKKRLEDKVRQLEAEVNRERQAKDKAKSELEQNLVASKEQAIKESITFQAKEIPTDVLYNTIKDKKVLLVGGDKLHANIIDHGYTSIELMNTSNLSVSMHSSQKYDLVVICTKLVSHTVVKKVEAELEHSGIHAIRYNQAGISTLIYTLFMYFNGGEIPDIGEYEL